MNTATINAAGIRWTGSADISQEYLEVKARLIEAVYDRFEKMSEQEKVHYLRGDSMGLTSINQEFK